MSNNVLSMEELTERFYVVKEQRDRFLAFARTVCPESPKGGPAIWDRKIGCIFVELMNCDRQKLCDMLDKAASFCPAAVQDEIRAMIASQLKRQNPSRLLEALKAIADPEHCLTAHTIAGLRNIATAALQECDDSYSQCVGVPAEHDPRTDH